jgi:hypothetical protein
MGMKDLRQVSQQFLIAHSHGFDSPDIAGPGRRVTQNLLPDNQAEIDLFEPIIWKRNALGL